MRFKKICVDFDPFRKPMSYEYVILSPTEGFWLSDLNELERFELYIRMNRTKTDIAREFWRERIK